MSYYRIHPASEPVETLLTEARLVSRVWVGEVYRRCAGCDGRGLVIDCELDCDLCDGLGCEAPCADCSGHGEVEDVRRGVSCCESLADLRRYFARRAWHRSGVVVELDGELSEDRDWEHDDGAVLVIPSRIVRTLGLVEAGLFDLPEVY